MSLLKTQQKTFSSDNNQNRCPNCANHIARIADLKGQVSELSNAFAQAVSQIKNNQKLKNRAAELDERLIEECVRAKTDAQTELNTVKRQYAEQSAKLKNEAQSKINQLTGQNTQLKQQLNSTVQKYNELNQRTQTDRAAQQQLLIQIKTQAQKKIQDLKNNSLKQQAAFTERIQYLEQTVSKLTEQIEVLQTQTAAQKAQSDHIHQQQLIQLKQKYEQKIIQLNSKADTQIQAQQQELAKLKNDLNQAIEQISVKARQAARAEELNARLLEQCNMAKLGADTAISEHTKNFTVKFNKFKTETADKLTKASEQNVKIKNSAQQALEKAAQRIQTLEHTLNNLRISASLIEPNLCTSDSAQY